MVEALKGGRKVEDFLIIRPTRKRIKIAPYGACP
jgi:hypothetical protein